MCTTKCVHTHNSMANHMRSDSMEVYGLFAGESLALRICLDALLRFDGCDLGHTVHFFAGRANVTDATYFFSEICTNND